MDKFKAGKTYIPPSGQVITQEDKDVLHSVVNGGWYTEWTECAKFSKSLAKVLDTKNVHLVNSGSSASLVAISAMTEFLTKLKGEFTFIITCATGFPTTVSPIYQCGKIPIYIDIDPLTLLPNFEQLDQAIIEYGNDIGFAVLAHTLGFPFREVQCGVPLVADCCDALGSMYFFGDKWWSVGSMADVATLSFFPAHQITSGEGGAVFSSLDYVSPYAESLISWGRSCYCKPGQQNTCGHRFDWEHKGQLPEGWDHKYIFDRLGYNLKMTEFQAALGNSQLSRLMHFTAARRENYKYLLDNLFIYNEEFFHFVAVPEWSNPSPFGFPILLRQDIPFTVSDITQYLESKKIGTRRVFGGNLTKQPAFMKMYHKTSGDLTGSDKVMNDMFWIGCQPDLGKPELDYIIEQFDGFFQERGL
jgi:CDP-6-deoxy-D-xylo-4-hexulose-3-dehydrase